MSKENPDCIIARCPDCNHVVFAAVNKPEVIDHEMLKDIGALIMSGKKMEHMDVELVRKEKWGCKCK